MNIQTKKGASKQLFLLIHFFILLTIKVECIAAENIHYLGVEIPDLSGKVMTVRGAIDPDTLGPTLMHEHLFIDYWLPLSEPDRWQQLYKRNPPSTSDEIEVWEKPFSVTNQLALGMSRDTTTLTSVEDAIHEVMAYQKLGGKSIVEMTSIGLNRQPKKLKEVADKTGIQIVAGTGFYSKPFHPKNMSEYTVEKLTLQMVRDITEGIDGTGVRAGIIGEVSTGNLVFNPVESDQVRVIRASARASLLTGVSISLHNSFHQDKEQLNIALDILEEEGVDLSRVVMGHVSAAGKESIDIAFLETLLKRGVYLQFDYLGLPSPYSPELDMETIKILIDYGYCDQILVSQDIFSKPQLSKFGGYGFTFVNSKLLPYLRRKGVGERAISRIVEENPKVVLTMEKPKIP